MRFLALLSALLLTGCLGSDPKRFSNSRNTGNINAPVDTTDNFVLEFALRDVAAAGVNTRDVVIQGRVGSSGNLFANICGTDASRCSCNFFDKDALTTPIAAASKAVNLDLNLFSCTIPAAVADGDLADIEYVRLQDNTGTIASGQLRIRTSLTLTEVLGSGVTQDKVRKIYAYTCARTFLEGSGISGGSIQCVNGMQLASLGANYQFYLFQQVDLSADNFASRVSETFYGQTGTVCGLVIRRVSCGTQTLLKYGLLASPSAKFPIKISLTAGPDQPITDFGYSARTDTNVVCPPGLVKVRQFQAVPSTYTGGNSNFVNDAQGSLNDNRLDLATTAVPNFVVQRLGPTGTCDAAGNCPAPGGSLQEIQSVAYNSLNPILCVIPPNLLEGI